MNLETDFTIGVMTIKELTVNAIMKEVESKVDRADGPCYPARYGFSVAIIYMAVEQILRLKEEVQALQGELEALANQEVSQDS